MDALNVPLLLTTPIFMFNSYTALREWITPLRGVLLVFLIRRLGLPRDVAWLIVGAWVMGQFEALHRRRRLLWSRRSDGGPNANVNVWHPDYVPPQMRRYYGPGF